MTDIESIKKNIGLRWFKNKGEYITDIHFFEGGQCNDTFLINDALVMKVYKHTNKYENSKNLQYFCDSFVPIIYECIDNAEYIKSPIILMEYIKGENLAEVYYQLNRVEKEEIAISLGKILEKIHSYDKQDIIVDTKELYNGVYEKFENAKEIGFLQSYQVDELQGWFDTYVIKNVKSEGCRIHGDFHIENIMLKENGSLVVLDWDSSRIGHGSMESMLIEQSIIPSGVVAERLEKYYPNGYCIPLLKSIVNTYPGLFNVSQRDEIYLQTIERILDKYCVDPESQVERALEMGKYFYDTIFVDLLLEDVFDVSRERVGHRTNDV